MREHMGLYRGKRIDNGEWIEGYYKLHGIHLGTIEEVIYPTISAFGNYPLSYEVDPKTVGECTGLRDKNGKLVFEGDVVAFEDVYDDYEGYHDNVFVNHGEVKYHPQCGVYFTDRVVVEMDDLWCNNESVDAEIIGNIHDNPELLKGGRGTAVKYNFCPNCGADMRQKEAT